MTYCWPTDIRYKLWGADGNDPWTSPHTYKAIYSRYLAAGSVATASQTAIAPDAFRVTGQIYTNGTADLDPIVETTLVNPDNNPSEGTQYCVKGARRCRKHAQQSVF